MVLSKTSMTHMHTYVRTQRNYYNNIFLHILHLQEIPSHFLNKFLEHTSSFQHKSRKLFQIFGPMTLRLL